MDVVNHLSFSTCVVCKTCRCPALLITGQHSVFNASTRSLHQAITKRCTDKTKVEFIEVAGVANVVEEKVSVLNFLLCIIFRNMLHHAGPRTVG